jgi:peptidoglycan/LPS O-acetylase OafA/YrhL
LADGASELLSPPDSEDFSNLLFDFTGSRIVAIPPLSQFICWHAAYLSNTLFVLNPSAAADSAHFWTLSVEEQFYLVWPLLMLLVPYQHLLRVIL